MRPRTQAKLVALTLLALVGQMLFAASHLHGLGRDRDTSDAVAFTATDYAHKEKTPHRGNKQDCPFCWMMDNVGSAVVIPPPSVPTPSEGAGTTNQALDQFEFKRVFIGHFQARGPPQLLEL
jgi:hypothetical protein